ncbi:MAG: sulfatase-like hydrolase/transferase, partial [Candidatus Marinimicrobia bacterium]|nr:sulfatase-like hydrolase/transferase [Candidatus Neomarinimicrobiota bacterium]
MSRKFNRREFLKTCTAGVAALAVPTISLNAASGTARPNIIIIMADDLGYGDLSTYGGWIETPALDRMAEEGMKFTDYHASAPVCSPTRTALLTGRYQQRAGIPGVVYAGRDNNRHQGLRLHELTFAEVAKEAGYATGVFGKWHVGYQEKFNPVHQGFDEFRGYVSGNVDYFSHIDGIGVHDWWDENEKIHEEGYVTHLINDHSVQFIRDHQDEPFCLYVAHEAPHFPFQGPDDEAIREEGNPGREDRDPERVKRAYTEMVQVMDDGIGQILDTLQELDLAENTFVFFCSDNGALSFGSNGDLRGWKGSLWEGGHRVPAIAWWPGKVEPGSTT